MEMKLTFKNDGRIIDAASGEYIGRWEKRNYQGMFSARVGCHDIYGCYFKSVSADTLTGLREMVLNELNA